MTTRDHARELKRLARSHERLAERTGASFAALRRAIYEASTDGGMTYREIAEVVGISHQRVAQIVAEERS